ncbi:MAG TPA: methyltransferase domain-containing protein, partial [Nocardioidaceae bacterium]|nr:methyltransferase domain-containing protein [Nocardioidaceae bacterium]
MAQNSAQRRSMARTAVVWDAVQGALAPLQGATVVDIGGGTGGLAVRVAELGHRVTVVDPSPDALAILGRRAEESGVADKITGLQGDLAGLLDLVPEGGADVVLCHGVLEIVEPAAALTTLSSVLRPGGILSLLVNQRHAAVLARAMAGHFGQAKAMLDSQEIGPTGRRFTADEVVSLLDKAGFDAPTLHAVRVFVDLVPSTLVDLEPGAVTALVELEKAVAGRPEYLPL